jgi:predicted dithiol-disulfide oxidoreductase (DUF899 family)
MSKPIKYNYFGIEPAEEYLARRKREDKKRDEIKKKNDELIAKWRSIPWYRFWEKPSFEEQRRIIMENWHSIDKTI